MYLSRLILNPRSRTVQRELADLYRLHRTLMRAFPDGLAEGEERILFRVDESREGGIPVCLVQSWLEPDWTFLEARRDYLLPLDSLWWEDHRNPAVKPFDPVFRRGQLLVFRLRANPTVKRQGKRHALFKEALQRKWIERKAAEGGFRLLSLTTISEGNRYGYRPLAGKRTGSERDGKRAHRLTLYAVRFEGTLTVQDPDRFAATIQRGIGPGKGLGFGLLSVAPPR